MGICRIVVALFVILWAVAAVLLAIGTFGWFGQERDPLSGVFLVPLGLPWNRIADALGVPGLVAGLFAPGINLLIFGLLCRLFRKPEA